MNDALGRIEKLITINEEYRNDVYMGERHPEGIPEYLPVGTRVVVVDANRDIYSLEGIIESIEIRPHAPFFGTRVIYSLALDDVGSGFEVGLYDVQEQAQQEGGANGA